MAATAETAVTATFERIREALRHIDGGDGSSDSGSGSDDDSGSGSGSESLSEQSSLDDDNGSLRVGAAQTNRAKIVTAARIYRSGGGAGRRRRRGPVVTHSAVTEFLSDLAGTAAAERIAPNPDVPVDPNIYRLDSAIVAAALVAHSAGGRLDAKTVDAASRKKKKEPDAAAAAAAVAQQQPVVAVAAADDDARFTIDDVVSAYPVRLQHFLDEREK